MDNAASWVFHHGKDRLLCLFQALQFGEAGDTVSEWLRSWTRNPMGFARRGSNPLGVVFFLERQRITLATLSVRDGVSSGWELCVGFCEFYGLCRSGSNDTYRCMRLRYEHVPG